MKPRVKRPAAGEVVIPASMMARVRATAAVLGVTPLGVVVAGCRLICTYVLAEIEPRLRPGKSGEKGVEGWQVEKLVKALALSLGRKRPS